MESPRNNDFAPGRFHFEPVPNLLGSLHIVRCRQRGRAAVGGSQDDLIGELLTQVSGHENTGNICTAFFIRDHIPGSIHLHSGRHQAVVQIGRAHV